MTTVLLSNIPIAYILLYHSISPYYVIAYQILVQFILCLYRFKYVNRYIQIGVYIRGFQDKTTKKFVREIAEVAEFYVNDENEAVCNLIYKKTMEGRTIRHNPSKYLLDYLEGQGVILPKDMIKVEENDQEAEAAPTQVESTPYQTETTPVEPVTPVSQIPVQPQPQTQTTAMNQVTGAINPQMQQPSSVFMNQQVQTPVQPVNNQNTSDVESLF